MSPHFLYIEWMNGKCQQNEIAGNVVLHWAKALSKLKIGRDSGIICLKTLSKFNLITVLKIQTFNFKGFSKNSYPTAF